MTITELVRATDTRNDLAVMARSITEDMKRLLDKWSELQGQRHAIITQYDALGGGGTELAARLDGRR